MSLTYYASNFVADQAMEYLGDDVSKLLELLDYTKNKYAMDRSVRFIIIGDKESFRIVIFIDRFNSLKWPETMHDILQHAGDLNVGVACQHLVIE